MAQNNNVNSNQNQNNNVVNNAPTNSQNVDNQNASRASDAKDLASGLGGIFSGGSSRRGGNNRFMESALPRNNGNNNASSNSGKGKNPFSPKGRPSARDNINNAKQRYNQAKQNANNPYKNNSGKKRPGVQPKGSSSSGKSTEPQKKNALQRGMDKAKVARAGLGVAKSYAEGAVEALQNVAHPVEYAKQKVKVVVARKVIAIVGSLLAGCMPFLLIGLILFILLIAASSLGSGLFDDDDSNSSNAGNGVCSYRVNNKEVSNIKVQLLNCEGNTPVEGEELIDFETYITGVVSQENGDGGYEALKAQAVASRSFALTRPKQMGGGFGTKLEEKNGQWILSLRSCVNDQVFCNPDKGCWSNCEGGQTHGKGTWSQCTVHSGEDKSKKWSRAAISENSKVRQAVKETEGEVLLDKNGVIVVTDFTNSNQQKWNKLAKEGKHYFEILMSDYGSKHAANLKASCSSDSSIDANIDSADVEKITNLSQSEAWNLLIGKSSNEYAPYISKSEMDKRTTTIKVPVRQWSSQSGHNPGKDTAKKEVSITVNKNLASFWLAFFTDVYNNAPDFVISDLSCYGYRSKTGGNDLSAHAYGVACDINPSVTANKYETTSYSKSKWQSLPETRAKYESVYIGSAITQIAHKYTIMNGSDWNNPHDAMHFSFIGDKDRDFAKKCKGKTTCS